MAFDVTKVQFFDHTGRVLCEATGKRARLYRAAPDLLAALQACYDAMQAAQAYIPPSAMAYRDEVIASLLNARAAIAKAAA